MTVSMSRLSIRSLRSRTAEVVEGESRREAANDPLLRLVINCYITRSYVLKAKDLVKLINYSGSAFFP